MSRLSRGLAGRGDRSSPYLLEDELREYGRSFSRRWFLKFLVMCPFQIGLCGGYFHEVDGLARCFPSVIPHSLQELTR